MAGPELPARLRAVARQERIGAGELQALAEKVFARCHLAAEDAALAAEIVIHPQLCGTDSHGLVAMPLYVSGLLDGTIKAAPEPRLSAGTSQAAVVDADHGLGLLIGHRAMTLAMEMARNGGLGAVAVRNSSHFGTAGYFVELAAGQGMIRLAMSNSAPAIAPTGSRTAVFGTNPIGAAAPLPGGPSIVMDMAMSQVARSRIRQALTSGDGTIPEGWALDPEGRPTTDAAAAVRGALLPIGGPKGYGLALLVELLTSALSDGGPGMEITYEHVVKRPSRISHFFLALDPAAFGGREAFARRASHIAEVVGAARPIEPEGEVRLPGARAHRAQRDSRAEGLPLRPNLRIALDEVAGILEVKG